jgi:hypothetical protein
MISMPAGVDNVLNTYVKPPKQITDNSNKSNQKYEFSCFINAFIPFDIVGAL